MSLDAPARPPFSQLAVYAVGQFGWSLGSFGAFNLLAYFYLPTTGATGQNFPTYLFSGAVLGGLTVIGLLGFGGRFFDALLDPVVASWSDRRASRWGKRRVFMAASAVPFAMLGAVVFWPLFGENQGANAAFLAFSLTAFYVFFSLYTIPYTALLSELGHDERDRMPISTLISVAWAGGFLLGSNVFLFQSMLEKGGLAPVAAFQKSLFGLAVVAAAAMLVPVFLLDEKKYALQQSAQSSLRASLATVFRSRNFRFFALSDLFCWLALTFIQMGVPFYMTLLLGFETEKATVFLTIGAVGSFILFLPVHFLVRRFGKKKVVLAGFWTFSALFIGAAMLGQMPVSREAQFYGLAGLAAFPLSVFGIVPNALLADLIDAGERATGERTAGMFFAARAFMMKVGVSLANLIFPSLLLLGKSIENPTGVRASAVAAAVFCLFGLLFFRKYADR